MKKDWFENPILFGICYYGLVFFALFVFIKVFKMSGDDASFLAEMSPFILMGMILLIVAVQFKIQDIFFEIKMKKRREKGDLPC